MGLWPFLGGSNHSAKLGEGDEYFDLDDLEYMPSMAKTSASHFSAEQT